MTANIYADPATKITTANAEVMVHALVNLTYVYAPAVFQPLVKTHALWRTLVICATGASLVMNSKAIIAYRSGKNLQAWLVQDLSSMMKEDILYSLILKKRFRRDAVP
jgi:hypothetical protein